MGLDITAMKNLKIAENPKYEYEDEDWLADGYWTGGASMKWSEEHFMGRGEGVDPDAVYEYEDVFNFRAGSYIGYGLWRDELERFASEILCDESQFQELINFADNEGVIGSVVSKKLLNDFVANDEKAQEYSKMVEDSDGKWFYYNYCNWKKACEFASQNGAIDFH